MGADVSKETITKRKINNPVKDLSDRDEMSLEQKDKLNLLRYSLLGFDLYKRCSNGISGQVTKNDLLERLEVLKSLYFQDIVSKENNSLLKLSVDYPVDFYNNYKFSDEDKEKIKEILEETGFSFVKNRSVKKITYDDINILKYVCEIKSINSESDYLNYILDANWFDYMKIIKIEKMDVFMIPKDTILFHGTSYLNNSEINELNLPLYFATMGASAAYAFGLDYLKDKEPQIGERGKIRMYRLKEPLYIWDASNKNNWNNLYPKWSSFKLEIPEDIQTTIKKTYRYGGIKSKKSLRRLSSHLNDKIVHNYLCEKIEKLNLDGLGHKQMRGLHDEIILCSKQSLNKIELLPYEIIMKNSLFEEDDTNEIRCVYVVKKTDKDNYEYVGAVSETEIHSAVRNSKEYESIFSESLKLDDNIKKKLRNMCLERNMGNRFKTNFKYYGM